jgi:hypothetical protein
MKGIKGIGKTPYPLLSLLAEPHIPQRAAEEIGLEEESSFRAKTRNPVAIKAMLLPQGFTGLSSLLGNQRLLQKR